MNCPLPAVAFMAREFSLSSPHFLSKWETLRLSSSSKTKKMHERLGGMKNKGMLWKEERVL